MFREMMRKKQQLSSDECKSVLKNEVRGVLSVLGDDGYPYGMPMNFYFDEESGNIYFHGGKTGHKIDAIKNCDKVSFCVYDQGFRRDGEWALNIKSVIVFGKIKPIVDEEKIIDISQKLSRKFTTDESYIENEIKHFAKATLCLELVPEFITGKIVNEA